MLFALPKAALPCLVSSIHLSSSLFVPGLQFSLKVKWHTVKMPTPPPHLMHLPVSHPDCRSKIAPPPPDFLWKLPQLATTIKRRRAAPLGKDPARNSTRLQLRANCRGLHAAEAARPNLDSCLALVSLFVLTPLHIKSFCCSVVS